MSFIKTLDPMTAFRIGQIYTSGIPDIPEGYTFKEFRKPNRDEYYITLSGDIDYASVPTNEFRIILSTDAPPKIVTKKTFRHITTCKYTLEDVYEQSRVPIPVGYEYLDFRFPKMDEYFIGTDGFVYTNHAKWNEENWPRIILKRKTNGKD